MPLLMVAVVVVVVLSILRGCESTDPAPPSLLTDLDSNLVLEIAQRLPLQAQLRLAAANPRTLGWIADQLPDKWLRELVDPETATSMVTSLLRHYPPRLHATEAGQAAACPSLSWSQAVALYDRVMDPGAIPDSAVRAHLVVQLIGRIDTVAFFSLMIAACDRTEPLCADDSADVVLARADLVLPDPHVLAEIAASLPPAVVAVVSEVVEALGLDQMSHSSPAVERVRAVYPAPFRFLFPRKGSTAPLIFKALLQTSVADAAGRLRPVMATDTVFESLLALGLRPDVHVLLPHLDWLPPVSVAIAFVDNLPLPSTMPISLIEADGPTTGTFQLRPLRGELEFGPLFEGVAYLIEAAPQYTALLRRHPQRLMDLIQLLVKFKQWSVLTEITSQGIFRYAELEGKGRDLILSLIAMEIRDSIPPGAQSLLQRLFTLPNVGLYRDETGQIPTLRLIIGHWERFPSLLYGAEFLDWALTHIDHLVAHWTQLDNAEKRHVDDWLSSRDDIVQLSMIAARIVSALEHQSPQADPLT